MIGQLLLPSIKKFTNLCKLQDYGDNIDAQMPTNNDGDESENEDSHWQTGLFQSMEVLEDDVQRMAENDMCILPAVSTSTSAITDATEQVDANEPLTEQEIEDFIRTEQIAASEGNNAPFDSVYTPQIDQQFDSNEAAQHFFNMYAFLLVSKLS